MIMDDMEEWERRYIRELRPERRAKMLSEYGGEIGINSDEYIIRKELLEKRYLIKKGISQDRFLYGWTNLAFLKESVGHKVWFFKARHNRKLAESVLKDWQLKFKSSHEYRDSGDSEGYEDYGELNKEGKYGNENDAVKDIVEKLDTKERILYGELFNMTLLYISICRNSKSYSSIIMGIGQVGEKELFYKIVRDIEETCAVPAAIGMAEEFRIFTLAAKAALEEYKKEYEDYSFF